MPLAPRNGYTFAELITLDLAFTEFCLSRNDVCKVFWLIHFPVLEKRWKSTNWINHALFLDDLEAILSQPSNDHSKTHLGSLGIVASSSYKPKDMPVLEQARANIRWAFGRLHVPDITGMPGIHQKYINAIDPALSSSNGSSTDMDNLESNQGPGCSFKGSVSRHGEEEEEEGEVKSEHDYDDGS